MKRMLSGIKPSGQLHLGNYIGALKQFVSFQDEYEMFIFIANLHCITVPQDPSELQKNLHDCAAVYLACGLDPNKVNLFLQSDVMEHAQLGFILSCNSYLGELNRMTQFKDKAQKSESNLSVGLYTYPTLMAADILMYDADYVPVGNDQKQHVELARDIAIRFNNRYSTTFVVPEPLHPKVGARIMSLSDPSKKMSKSDQTDKGCVYLLDDLKVARKKVMSAITDNYANVKYDVEKQPGVSNLLTILSSLTSQSIETLENKYQGVGYGQFKADVADAVCGLLSEIQERYQKIVESGIMEEVFTHGASKARIIANQKLFDVQQKIGLEIFRR
jgi:tryptophanyl-tRNA synthetase